MKYKVYLMEGFYPIGKGDSIAIFQVFAKRPFRKSIYRLFNWRDDAEAFLDFIECNARTWDDVVDFFEKYDTF